ncbi:MBL fold metallo-hydrolase [Kineococcus rhizosphaerae]|uniref:L-ascorbate metabolism protein UlaG (Beta-lactamase superfamily) n=1 Tax=Kineococcus rhizosphaerae TaxID=559628 RepID=A0A2T0R7Z7_9ACTN|nr:MBL fold metallo-hydrolase [Kineococcus rhizosphaerae]PRY17289.1 L-ascorbate metabolism protein UlaG (beta-lactamase superfamily) [Kineococcus rhizosphaerae]
MSVDVTWLGHSTVTVDVRDTTGDTGGDPAGRLRIVTDPVLRAGLAHLRRRPRTPDPSASAGCDLALVSHLHHDHLDLPSLRRLRPAVLVTPPGASDWVRWRLRLPATRVLEVAVGGTAELELAGGAVRVSALPAHHAGHRTGSGLSRAPRDARAVEHLVRVPGAFPARAETDLLLWAVGDTGEFEASDAVLDAAGRAPDVALVPVGGWGHTLGPHHLDPRQAAELVARVRPVHSVPVHWGTLHPVALSRTMGDRFVDPGPRFVEHARRLGVPGAVHLPVGGRLTLDGTGQGTR